MTTPPTSTNLCSSISSLRPFPDYSIVTAGGHNVLCIGGAISVDWAYRKYAWERRQANLRLFGRSFDNQDPLAPNYYWSD